MSQFFANVLHYKCHILNKAHGWLIKPNGDFQYFEISVPHKLKFMSVESVMPSNHFTLCRPLLLLTSIFPSIRVFSNESVLCIRWPKYGSFSFSISPSKLFLFLSGKFHGERSLAGYSPCSRKKSDTTEHMIKPKKKEEEKGKKKKTNRICNMWWSGVSKE